MPATAGRVPMPAGNRVVTGNALKVSDRWSSIVGSDPYASEKKEDGDVMEKLWADQRLHGNKRKIGTDERGIPIFEMLNGAEKREKRKGDAMAAREREYQLMQEKKRRMDEVRAAEQELAEASHKASKKHKKDKKDKKDKKKKKKKEKKEKKEKKKKHKKEKKSRRDRSSSDSSSDSSSNDDSDTEDSTEKFRLSGFFKSKE